MGFERLRSPHLVQGDEQLLMSRLDNTVIDIYHSHNEHNVQITADTGVAGEGQNGVFDIAANIGTTVGTNLGVTRPEFVDVTVVTSGTGGRSKETRVVPTAVVTSGTDIQVTIPTSSFEDDDIVRITARSAANVAIGSTRTQIPDATNHNAVFSPIVFEPGEVIVVSGTTAIATINTSPNNTNAF